MENPDTAWLTYDEAAAKLGIKADSVRRRAAGRKWPRRVGNDGLARVGIPVTIIPDRTPVAIPDDNTEDPDNSDKIRIAVLEAEGRQLRERLDEMRIDRDRLAGLLEKALDPRPVQVAPSFWARLFSR